MSFDPRGMYLCRPSGHSPRLSISAPRTPLTSEVTAGPAPPGPPIFHRGQAIGFAKSVLPQLFALAATFCFPSAVRRVTPTHSGTPDVWSRLQHEPREQFHHPERSRRAADAKDCSAASHYDFSDQHRRSEQRL